MKLSSLVMCSDEKIVRVLRRVLSDLEITMEACSDASEAIRVLTRHRFEAVIVDCVDEKQASLVLKSARVAPCNKRAIAVAIIDGQTAVHGAFDLGAHFVLYKPISMERTKASFRAARALMKRERRRNTRVPIQLSVGLVLGANEMRKRVATTTSDLGEGGLALQTNERLAKAGKVQVEFTLPGSKERVTCDGEVAWENAGRQAGIRFVDLSAEVRTQLKNWVAQQSPEMEADDPPVRCRLTDLSPGSCYLETATPFPATTRVLLGVSVSSPHVYGVVRVMHPESGMGVEFVQRTEEQREQLEQFIQALMKNQDNLPELLVEADGLDSEPAPAGDGLNDPLTRLLRKKAALPVEMFLKELRRQRGGATQPKEASFSI